MTLTQLAWIALVAYALHIMEEYSFDWRDWARAVIKLPVEWTDFYITNAVVVILGFIQAELASSLPIMPLTFAALLLINATFLHVLPMIVTRGRYSPGVATSVLLFYPLGIAMFWRATEDGVSLRILGAAVIFGALLMAYPFVMLRIRNRPYFRQTS